MGVRIVDRIILLNEIENWLTFSLNAMKSLTGSFFK